MELRHLRYFIALADQLHFTRASQLLHVAQSTLSHQIGQLEQELGTLLFQRNTRGVRLTAAGELFLARANQAIESLDSGIRDVKAPPPVLSGEVRIGATPTFVAALVPEAIAAMASHHPSVRAVVHELTTETVGVQLLSGDIDIGLAYPPMETRGLSGEALYHEEMVLVVNAGHPLARLKQIRIADLHAQSMVFPTSRFSIRATLDQAFRAAGAEPRIVAEVDSFVASFALVEKLGVAALTPATVMPTAPSLRSIPLQRPFVLRVPTLYRRRGTRESAAAAELAKVLRKLGRERGMSDGHRRHR